MADLVRTLKSRFDEKNRYANFGACLRQLHIHGFRGIESLDLVLDFPITAISGLNGAGKSTLGQLAICAYKKPITAVSYKRQYVKDFFPISPADPKPITDHAKVVYTYETSDFKKPQETTVSRANSSWSGYKRQPERHCYYVGFTVYIPKVERRDLSVYGGAALKFTDKRAIDPDVITKMATLIGHKYEEVSFQGVSHKEKQSEIGIASRLGYSYSENNMGFGEGRILYTVDKLETAPSQSLFILEEPETSLHESAQHEFASYLLDVCNRKNHQIILSTHSSVILSALPPESRKLLIRTDAGVEIQNGVSTNQLKSVLSDGQVRSLIICVEDLFARVLLQQVLRAKKRHLLKSIAIHEIGDTNAVRTAVKLLNRLGYTSIGVRDGDIGPNKQEGLFSLPGTQPPEIEVFGTQSVIDLMKAKYDVDVCWQLDKDQVTDHHQYVRSIAAAAEVEEQVLRNDAIAEYVNKVTNEFDELIADIETAAHKSK